MDWQAIGTIVALLGVIASFVLSLRGQQQERSIAANSASRSEAAARLTEDYTSRVVDALERMAAGAPAGAPARPVVRWALTKASGDSFRLENTGTVGAYGVAIEGHRSLVGPDVVGGDAQLVGPGEALLFMAAMSMATSDITITVTWLDAPDGVDRKVWRYPLPV